MDYRAYLLSKAWKKKRAAARKRAGGRCRVCGTTKNLHTHHVSYKRLGNETARDLMMLCAKHHKGCHEYIAQWRKRGRRWLSTYALTMKYIQQEQRKEKK